MGCLVEEEEAASHVALEEVLQVIQHGGVRKHEVHQLVTHQTTQLRGEISCCNYSMLQESATCKSASRIMHLKYQLNASQLQEAAVCHLVTRKSFIQPVHRKISFIQLSHSTVCI